MNETRSHQWSSMFLYSMLCIVFLGVLYVVVETFAPETSSEFIPRDDALSARFISSYRWGNANQDAQNSTLSTPLKEKIMFVLDQDVKIGNSKMIYRGLDGNANFRMDIAILELDPNSFYRYRIPIKTAKKGFRLAGQDFRLISVRKTAIQLRHLKKK